MSQAQQNGNQNEIAELEGEIEFQKVLLTSIDDTVEDREGAEREVREEIKTLQKKVRALKRGTNRTPSKPRSSQTQQASQDSSPSRTPLTMRTYVGNDVVGTHSNRAQGDDSWSAASTPNSVMASNELFLTPSKMNLPTRKRSRTQVDGNLAPARDYKSQRTSPSPYMTNTAPPSSSGDSDFEELDSELYRTDPTYMRRQQEMAARLKQEEEDAEFARILSGLPSNAQPSQASGQSAFDRISGGRPGQPSSSMASTYSQPTRGGAVKSEPRMSSGVKRDEGSMGLTYSRAMPGSFTTAGDSDDSDLEIIESTAFRGNGRYRPSVAGISRASGLSKGSPATGLGHAHRTAASQYDWMQDPLPQSYAGMGRGKTSGIGAYGSVPGSYVYDSPRAGSASNGFGMGSSYGDMIEPGRSMAFDSIGNLRDNMAQGTEHMQGIYGVGYNSAMASQLDYVVNDPRKTNEEIKDLLENIKPDMDLPPESREGTPEGLKYPLYEHQKIALTWLKAMEEGTNKGGILADDMGLGKTISSLALILTRPSQDPRCKTTLIVGPVALVRQWEREFRSKIKSGHKLSVLLAHGAAKQKLSWEQVRGYDVVLTTYGTLSAELKKREKYEESQKAQGNILEREMDIAPMAKLFPFLGPKSKFYRVILDEAQCIKNKSTVSSRAACHLRSLTRWCLTGTPMMNNIGELFSLIKFLRIKPYNDWTNFSQAFGELSKPGHRDIKPAMKKLQVVLKAILLRRTKQTLIDGKPIIVLPEKTEEIQHVVFNEDEQAYYNALEQKTQLQFNKYMKAGTVGKNYSNILVLLLRLRQCCCHPHLITDFEEAPAGGVGISDEEMMELAKSLAPEVVTRLLLQDTFECPVCYDGVENPSIIVPCGHDACSECLTKISANEDIARVAQGNAEGNNGNSKCHTCRGVVDMKKIIDYRTFKKAHNPDTVTDPAEVETASENSDDETDADSDSDDSDESEKEDDKDDRGNLRGFIVPDNVSDTEDEDEDDVDVKDKIEDDDEDIDPAPRKQKAKSMAVAKSKKRSNTRRTVKKGKRKEKKKKKEHVSLAMLKKQANTSAAGRKRYMAYLKKNWQPSAKIDKCVELLDQFHAEDEKTIIFSQFVSLLDLLQVPIDEKGWLCERYDGSMSADARNDAIVRFTDDRDTKIMLISLKAGNAGLNLVAASRVIILDPFWNPFIEMQAVDRAYRIGQRSCVQVHRILIEGTVEDRIIELQENKKKLVNAALEEGAMKSLGRLDVAQLAFLFNGRD